MSKRVGKLAAGKSIFGDLHKGRGLNGEKACLQGCRLKWLRAVCDPPPRQTQALLYNEKSWQEFFSCKLHTGNLFNLSGGMFCVCFFSEPFIFKLEDPSPVSHSREWGWVVRESRWGEESKVAMKWVMIENDSHLWLRTILICLKPGKLGKLVPQPHDPRPCSDMNGRRVVSLRGLVHGGLCYPTRYLCYWSMAMVPAISSKNIRIFILTRPPPPPPPPVISIHSKAWKVLYTSVVGELPRSDWKVRPLWQGNMLASTWADFPTIFFF